MATFTTTTAIKKVPRPAQLSDTIGTVFTRDFSISVPASVGANDTSVLSSVRIPAGCAVIGAYMKASVNGTTNSGITLTSTTDTKAFVGAANANNVVDSWTDLTLVAANRFSTVDQTITLGCSGANVVSAAAWTADITLVLAGVGATTAPWSTFTI
jgi:hypothetical protein